MTRRPPSRRLLALGTFLSVALILGGCGTVANSRKIDYRNTPTLPPLEVPPDLSNLPDQKGPGSNTTYTDYAGNRKNQPASNAVLPQHAGIRLMRDGQTRFVLVEAEPAAVWDQVRDFLAKTGLASAKEDPRAGLIETEWAENRATVGARENSLLSRWVRSLHSTGTRDKYHVRLERGAAPNTTEIYIAHRGMEELEPDKDAAAKPGWKPRPSDPELEAEMLHRLVVHLGELRAGTQVAAAVDVPASVPASPSARLTRNGDGAALLTLEDSLERAWRRVGLSLDRIGFTVEDRDRSKGIYYVRYIDPDTQEKKPGFFSRMFSGSPPPPPNQFQVQIKPTDTGSSVAVLDKEGSPETSKTGDRILGLLYEQLK